MNMRNTRRFGAGFTLIELLVVILILAILAALIVPRVVNRSGEAKVSAAKSDIATLRGELNKFKLDTGRYPTTEEGLAALRQAPSDVTGWKGPYADQDIPLDPWQHEYQYQYPGPDGDDTFVVSSLGADGAEGGEGENADLQ
jgi:general secretion pathway protein G